MNAQESPAAVALLLGLLEGVEVRNVWQRELEVTIWVRVASIDSLSRIDQHATFANMHRLTIRSVGPPAPMAQQPTRWKPNSQPPTTARPTARRPSSKSSASSWPET